MKIEVAKALNPHVNAEGFQDDFNLYVDERIGILHSLLEAAPNYDTVCRHQGAIEELYKMKKLQVTVKAVLEVAKKR